MNDAPDDQTHRSMNFQAFISYRHLPLDRSIARWLLEALESFRIPGYLVRQGYPKRVGRIYRDEDENPTTADLGTVIDGALQSSGALIVICSTNTPQSRWIDREVERFQELGRGDRIIPLLIDGVPDTSFPHGLLRPDFEPTAADIRARPDQSLRSLKRAALLRIVASLIGCAFDDLVQRDAARTRRRRTTIAIGVGAGLLLAASALLFYARERADRLLSETALTLTSIPNIEDDKHAWVEATSDSVAANALSVVPRHNILKLDIPQEIVDHIAPAARRASLRRSAFQAGGRPLEDTGAESAVGPLAIALGADGKSILIGLEDGSLVRYRNGQISSIAKNLCPITAIAESFGGIAAGCRDGRVAVIGKSATRPGWITPSAVTVRQILWVSEERLVSADDGGGIFYLDATRGEFAATQIERELGSVRNVLPGSAGAVVACRSDGKVFRYSATGARTLLFDARLILLICFQDKTGLAVIRIPPISNMADSRLVLVRPDVRYANDWPSLYPARVDRGNVTASAFFIPPGAQRFLMLSDSGVFIGNADSSRPSDLELYLGDAASEHEGGARDMIVETSDRSLVVALHQGNLFVIDAKLLNRINSVLTHPADLRADLCSLDLTNSPLRKYC